MSGTTRTSYRGETIPDGEHGKKCPSADCSSCGTGFHARPARRAQRHRARTHISASEAGTA